MNRTGSRTTPRCHPLLRAHVLGRQKIIRYALANVFHYQPVANAGFRGIAILGQEHCVRQFVLHKAHAEFGGVDVAEVRVGGLGRDKLDDVDTDVSLVERLARWADEVVRQLRDGTARNVPRDAERGVK